MRRSPVASMLAALLTLTAACDGGDGADLPGPPPPRPAEVSASLAPGAGLTSAERRAVDEVLGVVDVYLAVFTELATTGVDILDESYVDDHAQLGQYGTLAGADFSMPTLERHYLQDQLNEGALGWELLEIVDVDLDRRVRGEPVPAVTIRICVDETQWTTVDRDTGERVDGPGGRHGATVRASYAARADSTLRPGPAWRLSEWDDQPDQPC